MKTGVRVLRTVYLPNEQVDSLLLTVESLRSQLSAAKQAEAAAEQLLRI